jgi:hypothetical protein
MSKNSIPKTAGFAAAAKNAELKTKADRPCWAVRALRWIFITAPRAVWRWICSIEIGGLANLAMLLFIIVLFVILIGQVLSLRCDRRGAVATPVPEIAATSRDNVEVTKSSYSKGAPAAKEIPVPAKKTFVILPMKGRSESAGTAEPAAVKVNGDVIVDGGKIGRRLGGMTKINGNLILQNMRSYTLPCGIKINGNLLVRNVRTLNFCGRFTVNGDIYVSSDSSFGPIPRSARIRGQVII